MSRPCPRCAAWEARYDKLADQFAQLALAKATQPRVASVVKPAPPDAELHALKSAEAEAVLDMEAQVVSATRGVPADVAKQELLRLRGLALETRVEPPTL